MTNSTKLVLSVVITYLITRGAFYLTNFNPTRDLKTIPGYALDIAIWVIVIVAIRWVLDKFTPTTNSPAACHESDRR